jgi:uncharacterized protein (TIGR02453 family)
MSTPSLPRIEPQTLQFLSDLERHNDRLWFEANKDRYVRAQANVHAVVDALIERMGKHDRIATETGRAALRRIYSDQRFHKDQPPYKPRFAGGLARVKPALRGGYFFHIAPGRSHLTCGFMGPNAEDLKRIRMDMLYDPATWKRLLNTKAIRSTFGTLKGLQVKTTPRGFPKEHEVIELIRHTQYLLRRDLTDQEVLAPDFILIVEKTYKAVRPLFDHMSEVLTSDADGNSLLR